VDGGEPGGLERLAEGALEAVVARLDPGTSGGRWVTALCGVPDEEVADLAELSIAHSHEAQVFLDLMPATVRQLQSTTTMHTERCVGHVRGPILWSETITAWSSGVGADDVFVCIAPVRDHDIAENRMVAWLLHRLNRASRQLDTAASMRFDDAARAEIARNAASARRWLAHRHLADVERRRPRPADRRKARSTRHRQPYEPAFALADRVDHPFVADELEDLLDERQRARLGVLAAILDELEDGGAELPPLRIAGRAVGAGRLVFRHPRHFPAEMAGIELAGTLLDVSVAADPTEVEHDRQRLARRAGGRPFELVTTRDGVADAVAAALRTVSRGAQSSGSQRSGA